MKKQSVSTESIEVMDKRRLQEIVAEQNVQMGFVPDPTATAQKAREMMLALGIRPEDNLGSCGIIAAREE
jgi:NADH/NAD ratio-sensing transcriptional regulator Rex